jgi:hypothetical protein
MQVKEAVNQLNKTVFRYIEANVGISTRTDYQTFTLTENQFFTVLPRISCCGFQPTLKETVNYITERETKLVKLYSDYNSYPYCQTWWFLSSHNDKITFGYETSSGTVIQMTISDQKETLYEIEIPIARANGFHDLLVRMAKAGATEEFFEIRHNFYRVTKEEYEKYAPWWNSTKLGETLPSWEEYQKQCETARRTRDEENEARFAKRRETQSSYEEDYDTECELLDTQEDIDYFALLNNEED